MPSIEERLEHYLNEELKRKGGANEKVDYSWVADDDDFDDFDDYDDREDVYEQSDIVGESEDAKGKEDTVKVAEVSKETKIEKALSTESEEEETISTLLERLVDAGLKYSDRIGQQISIKCKSNDGKSCFRHKYEPKTYATKRRKTSPTKPAPFHSNYKKTDQASAHSNQTKSKFHSKLCKGIIMDKCRSDLNNEKLIGIPYAEVNIIGWPADCAKNLNHLPIEQLRKIAQLVQSDELRFEYTEETKSLQNLVLKSCQTDLNCQTMKRIPSTRVNYIGWPENYSKNLFYLSLKQLQNVASLIKAGKIRFEWMSK